jgi:hypothetical protein
MRKLILLIIIPFFIFSCRRSSVQPAAAVPGGNSPSTNPKPTPMFEFWDRTLNCTVDSMLLNDSMYHFRPVFCSSYLLLNAAAGAYKATAYVTIAAQSSGALCAGFSGGTQKCFTTTGKTYKDSVVADPIYLDNTSSLYISSPR